MTASRCIIVETLAVHQVFDRYTPANTAADVGTLGSQARAARDIERICILRQWRRHRNGCRFTNASLHGCHAVDDLASDEAVPGAHGISQPNVNRGEPAGSGQLVHLRLVAKARLHHTEPAHCSAGWVVGAHRIAIDRGNVTPVRALHMRDCINQHCG